MKKRVFAALAILVLTVALLPSTALAHIGRHAACTLGPGEDCSISGVHRHDGVCFLGHTLDDGHDYHEACPVEGCPKICAHEHDGAIYLPNSSASRRGTHGKSGHGRRGAHHSY